MMKERKTFQKKKKKGAPSFMTTYGDMNTLLLTFFIAILAAGEVKPVEMRLVLSAFRGGFGMLDGGDTLSPHNLIEMGSTIESLPSDTRSRQLSNSLVQATEVMKPEIKDRLVRISETTKGYKLTLASDMFFRSGSAEIDYEKGKAVLRKVGMLLQDIPINYRIEVIGHTDTDRINPLSELGKIYPTNWELSTARASSVVRYLIDFGIDPRKFYAEGRSSWEPIETNASPEGKAYNRRIDIYVSIERDK